MADRILAVDDDAGMRRVLERTLRPRYDVELASSLSEARARVEASDFDVALVDIQLGDGDGYTLCREIKDRVPETDVILITGSHSEPDEKLFRSLEEGAFYFLFKPFERRVLRALVDRCFALRRAREAEKALARELSDDLARARQFQQSLVPAEPLAHAGWHVDGRFVPCDAIGGDFYMAIRGVEDHVVVALGDIVGHGVRAAMYAGMLRSLLDTVRRRDPNPAAVQRELLNGIDFFETESYASLVYARLGPTGRVQYFNAGHPPPLVLRRSGEIETLRTTALILTPMLPHDGAELDELELAKGDRLLIFSDGIYEALDPREREWGLEGLTDAFRRALMLPPSEALDHIMTRLEEHTERRPLTDDATLVLVDRSG